jgi:protein-S-isoprenylcysteine O-methyltransferase Ste14
MIVQLCLVPAILFLSAGSMQWIMGWAVVGLYACVMVATLAFIQVDSAFLDRRIKIDERTKGWDKYIAGILRFISPIGILVVAGLDLRFGLSPQPSRVFQILSLLVAAFGYSLGIWAAAANEFYAGFVRIDQEHAVVSEGPYRFIRHPGYAGAILIQIGLPAALGSLWALLLGLIGSCLIVIRTYYEDRTLIQELGGYGQYSDRVAYRLLPGIW